jgi:hypothetical protein
LRNKSVGGDKTSKIFEDESPRALGGESQKSVDLFKIYTIVYGGFDKIIHTMDKMPIKKTFPNWFMTFVSLYGLVSVTINLLHVSSGVHRIYNRFSYWIFLFIFILIGIRKRFLIT